MTTVTNINTGHILTLERGARLSLPSSRLVVVPSLCFGTIPHDMEIELSGELILRMQEPRTLRTRNLLVETGEVEPGTLSTVVFNLSNEPVRVSKGMVVSRLYVL